MSDKLELMPYVTGAPNPGQFSKKPTTSEPVKNYTMYFNGDFHCTKVFNAV
jgi:hypothetical protein